MSSPKGSPVGAAAAALLRGARRRNLRYHEQSVEEQTEAARGDHDDNLWNAVLKADLKGVQNMIARNRNIVWERGPVGETALHMCFIYNTPKHKKLARYLVDRFPQLVSTIYNKPGVYYGESCLHIAVVNRDVAMVEWLVSKDPGLLSGRATGTFFQLGAPCAFGEYPIMFAACTNQRNIVDLLLRKGADLGVADGRGNTILHMCVHHRQQDMYDYIEQTWIELKKRGVASTAGAVDLWKRRNRDGYTPMTLAAHLGMPDMFSHLLDKRKVRQWSYGPVSCCLYPLEDLDLPLEDDEFGEDSGGKHITALRCIVEEEHVELLRLPMIELLLNKKWKRYAQRQFHLRFFVTLAYLSFFVVTTVLNPDVNSVVYDLSTWTDRVRLMAEAVVVCGALVKGYREMLELHQLGPRAYFATTGSGFLENTCSLGFCLCIGAASAMRMVESPAEDAWLAMASVLGWLYMLWFLLGFRLTGPFVVMIYKMLATDVLRWLCIYVVFLLGFSQAFHLIFDESGPGAYLSRLRSCFVVVLGQFDLEDYAASSYPMLGVGLLVIHSLIVSILLINLLIAMMGDTYSSVNEAAELQWLMERSRIIFSIESEMSREDRQHPSNKYWTMADGKRFLQVEETNAEYFAATAAAPAAANAAEEAAAAAAAAAESAGRSMMSQRQQQLHQPPLKRSDTKLQAPPRPTLGEIRDRSAPPKPEDPAPPSPPQERSPGSPGYSAPKQSFASVVLEARGLLGPRTRSSAKLKREAPAEPERPSLDKRLLRERSGPLLKKLRSESERSLDEPAARRSKR